MISLRRPLTGTFGDNNTENQYQLHPYLISIQGRMDKKQQPTSYIAALLALNSYTYNARPLLSKNWLIKLAQTIH